MGRTNRGSGIGRREALKKLMAGGAASAVPALGRPAPPGVSSPSGAHPVPLGSAFPPDPRLTSEMWKPIFFDSHQNETVVVLSDLIIPETDTPGAKAAQVNRFIDLLLDAESAETQQQYTEALSWLDGYCLSHHSKPFTALDAPEQSSVLTLLTYPAETPDLKRGVELFGIIKSSIVQAYYTSEIGLIRELRYQTNPYQPNFPGCDIQK